MFPCSFITGIPSHSYAGFLEKMSRSLEIKMIFMSFIFVGKFRIVFYAIFRGFVSSPMLSLVPFWHPFDGHLNSFFGKIFDFLKASHSKVFFFQSEEIM